MQPISSLGVAPSLPSREFGRDAGKSSPDFREAFRSIALWTHVRPIATISKALSLRAVASSEAKQSHFLLKCYVLAGSWSRRTRFESDVW
jgi:hypothetical protein